MIQDIGPKHFNNEYKNIKPAPNDRVFYFKNTSVLARIISGFDGVDEGELDYPTYDEFQSEMDFQFTYLFSVDDDRFFLASDSREIQKGRLIGETADSKVSEETFLPGYVFIGVNSFRRALPKDLAFAAISAFHLAGWYRDNRFCGRCGNIMRHDDSLRMMRCDCCNNMVFPKINPAVIVAVTNKDKILLTKYVGRTYRNYALVAGYTEIGETTEESVRREVLEEVGLKVKNIQYYKSQPWGLSGSQLFGYFCELDGDDTITLQEDELAIGTWVRACDIEFVDDHISLTREMIEKFRREHI